MNQGVILLCTFVSNAVVCFLAVKLINKRKGRFAVEAYLMMIFLLFPVGFVFLYILFLSIFEAFK